MSPEDEQRSIAEKRIGTVLRDKYRVDKVLGVGGMAVVYKVTHRNQAEFALKMLHPQFSMHEYVRSRFLREGYAANSVKHPGTVLVVDDDVDEDGTAFLVMELLAGASVEELWERCEKHMPVHAAVAVAHQLLDVLAAAHAKNVVHRDIKPANVFVTREGVVKVLDFGIARLRDSVLTTSATQTGIAMGTPGFMPPEQALGRVDDIDGQTDVWAAGATLYTLLSGRFVHQLSEGDTSQELMIRAATLPAPSLATVAPGVPPAIVKVVDTALAFDKKQRWLDASAMRDALSDAHTQSFGIPVSRQRLADLLTGAAPLPFATTLAASMTPEPVNIRASVPATEEPVELPRRRVGVVVAVFAAFIVLGVGVSVALKLARGRGSAPDGVPGETVSIAAAPSSSSVPSAAALSSVALPLAGSDEAPVPSADLAQTLPSSSKPAVRPTPAPPPSPRPTTSGGPAPAPKPGCNPPYTIDSEGHKHFKLECY
jgi:eukaryotic-like serine/threonine-protein kinase